MRKSICSFLISACLLGFTAFSHADVLSDITAFEVQKVEQSDFVLIDVSQDVLPVLSGIEMKADEIFFHSRQERISTGLIAAAENATAYPTKFEVGWRSTYQL